MSNDGKMKIIMAKVEINDLSEEMVKRLNELACERQSSVDALIRDVLEWELKKAAWWSHWDTLPRFDREIDAVELLRESRERRENGLE